MSNGEESKISVREEFEKETNIVVIFGRGIEVYERDCQSLRDILGQAFPLLFETVPYKEPKIEKWLMRKESWSEKLVKETNLSNLEEELGKYGDFFKLSSCRLRHDSILSRRSECMEKLHKLVS